MADSGGSIRPGIKKGAVFSKPPLFKGNGRCRPGDLAIVLIHSPEGLNVQKERLFLSFFDGGRQRKKILFFSFFLLHHQTLFSILTLLTGGKGPNEDTIQNQIRKNKTMNDNKIITTEDGEEINLAALECEFGSYHFEGKTYYAARQMELTNRLFDGCYNDAEDGDEYISEYSAPGYDETGTPVEIFMAFPQVKGEEVDPENLNWIQDANRVEAR